MAVTIGAAVRGCAAVPERVEIARIAGRPAAGAFRQINDGKPAVDRLLIGEIGSEGYRALGDGDVYNIIISAVHFGLWNVKGGGLRPQAREPHEAAT
jgi:hypothetical protein